MQVLRSFTILLSTVLFFVASTLFCHAVEPVRLSLISGPIGAAWYSLGSGFVKIIQQYCPDITITLEAGAAVKNVRVIAQNPNVIGFTNLDIAYYAIQGSREFDKKFPLQAMMAGHASQAYVISLEESGIIESRTFGTRPYRLALPQVVLKPLRG